jgi:uncharacterized repeat protein (TIGR01451 family)
VAVALILALAFAPATNASQSPVGCTGSNPVVRFATETMNQLDSFVRPGDSIVLGARISNMGSTACDLTEMTVTVRLPASDGTPGEVRTLASNVGLAAGGAVEVPTEGAPYVVDLNEGIFNAPLSISWQATVHSGEEDAVISGEGTGLEIKLTRPRTTLQIEADKYSGGPPLAVGFTYSLTNQSPASDAGTGGPSLVPGGTGGLRDLLSDAACAPLVYQSGDQPSLVGEPALDPGETWKFTCSRTYLLPGTYESQPLITGSSSVDSRPWPQPASGFTPVTVFGSDLTITKSHQGDLIAGGNGTYEVLVSNSGSLASTGTVTVTDQMPEGLAATAISGEGWNCDLATASCSRADSLPVGGSFPPVIVEVTVADDPPSLVTNIATVSGGGESVAAGTNNEASDPTKIRKPTQPEPPKGKVFRIVGSTSLGNGMVSLKVRVPVAGVLIVDDARKTDLVRTARKKTRKSGTVKVILKANRKLRQIVARKGTSRKVKIRVSFTAAGNPPNVSPISAFRQVTFDLRPPS